MVDVFISYSRRDKAFVERLNSALKDAGRDTWVDWESIPPTAEWLQEVCAGVEAAHALVFVISPDSIASEICAKELAHAVSHNKRLIPVLWREVDVRQLPEALASHNWISFVDDDKFDADIESLLGAMDTDLDSVRAHTRLLNRAIEWDKGGREYSLALRGKDLQRAESWLAQAGVSGRIHPTPLQTKYILESRRGANQRQRFTLSAIGTVILAAAVLSILLWQQRLRVNQYLGEALHEKGALALAHADALSAEIYFSSALTHDDRPETRQQLLQVRSRTARLDWLGPGGSDQPILAISADAREFLTQDRTGNITIWDMATKRVVRRLARDGQPALCAVFSPYGSLLGLGGLYRIEIWNLMTGRRTRTIPSRKHRITCLSFSPDGRRIAAGGEDQDIHLWDIASGRMILTLKGHTDKIDCVAFSPNGRLLASGSADYDARVWNLATRASMVLKGHEDEVLSAAFSPDGKTLATGGFDNRIWLWDIHSGNRLRLLAGHEGGIRSLAFTPDGAMLASGSDDNTVRLWDPEIGKEILTLRGYSGSVRAVEFGQGGRELATGGEDGALRLWGIAELGNRPEVTTLRGSRGQVTACSFSPNGRLLASSGADSLVRLWDLRSHSQIAALRGHHGQVACVSFSGDGRYIASGGKDSTVRLWDASNGTLSRALRGHHGQVWGVDFSADGRLLASASEDGTVRLWSVPGGQLVRVIRTGQGKALGVVFDPVGDSLASSGEDGTVRLWSRDGRCIHRFAGHDSPMWNVAFSHDGRWIVAGAEDGVIWIWNAVDGTLRCTLRGHNGAVWDVDFDPEGGAVASAGNDGTLRLWDLQTHQPTILTANDGPVWAAHFSRDGRMLAGACQDGRVQIWMMNKVHAFFKAPPGKLIAEAEQETGLELDPKSLLVEARPHPRQ
ncbi:MAG TPA: TIR domain-containing protein [Armatimonadota bacterium]|nr:TIR domain-containing protein [Armatimonadota bacterium]